MARDKFQISSAALVTIGASRISDFDGGSVESEVAGEVYQGVVDNYISLYPWRFCSRYIQLSRNLEPPETIWSASYQQPSNMVHLQGVFVGDCPIPFDRFEDKIFCDAGEADEVFAAFALSKDEITWPPYFAMLIEMSLQVRFSMALADRIDLKQTIAPDVEMQFRLAKSADSRQQTTKKLPLSGRGSLMAGRR